MPKLIWSPRALRDVIDFGDSGYVARYRVVPDTDTVIILAVRHQKEAGE